MLPTLDAEVELRDDITQIHLHAYPPAPVTLLPGCLAENASAAA